MILPEVLDSGSTRYDVAVVPGADTATSSAFRSDLGAAAATLDAEVRFHTVSDRSHAPARSSTRTRWTSPWSIGASRP